MKALLRPGLACLVLFAVMAPPMTGAEADPVETVQKAAADWINVRAETARLEAEWNSQQQILESMVSGYQERAVTLEGKRDYLVAKTAKDRTEIADLQGANRAASTRVQATEADLKALDGRLVLLRPALPPRLSAALELAFRSLGDAGLPLGERMQVTMTVLNRCTQFNRSIICEEELLAPDGGGATQLLEVIYWGMSHGYALDRKAGKTWFGSPGPQGWHWEALPDSAAAVAKLIAINQGKAEPALVTIPARVANQAAATQKN